MAKINHFVRTIDKRHAALIYNHQAIGKHPAVRFGSLLAKPAHPLRRVVRLHLHVCWSSMGGPLWGSRKARRFGLAPVFQSRFVPAHPLPKTSVGRSMKYQGGRTMSKSTKQSQPDSRLPVDALQYEKLALSAFHLCDRQLSHLNTLITLTSSMCRNPAVTSDERRRQQTMLELLVDTAEQYQQELECDRELYQVIALDAKGVPQSRITAKRAARLLTETSKIAGRTSPTERTVESKRAATGSATDVNADTDADAQQTAAVRH
jgi:hypothetical protein